MALALFKYRSAPHGLKKKANFFILEFNLDANPVVNPVTATIKKIFPKFLISWWYISFCSSGKQL